MNQSTKELADLGRIIQALKRFSQLVPDSESGSESLKEVYLKQHLSGQEWKLWKQLQADPVELLENNQELLAEKGLTRTQFSGLLGQYKRVGMESYHVWCQTQRLPDYGMGETLPSC